MSKSQKPRERTKTAITLAPLSVDEALSALLKTPTPKDEPKPTKGKSLRRKAK